MWRRKSCPSPIPSCAPSMRPGISASTIWRWLTSATPRLGTTVVKGYSAILGLAALTTLSRVDLPALGTPMMPTSATSFSSNSSQSSMPCSPRSDSRGALFCADLNDELPRPPRPPCSSSISWPGRVKSANTSPVSAFRMSVPGGTPMRRSSPLAPVLLAPPPCVPRSARK